MLSMEELKKKRQILSNFQAKSKNAGKDFPRDANPRGANLLFGIIFAESAWSEMKGVARPSRNPWSATGNAWFNWRNWSCQCLDLNPTYDNADAPEMCFSESCLSWCRFI